MADISISPKLIFPTASNGLLLPLMASTNGVATWCGLAPVGIPMALKSINGVVADAEGLFALVVRYITPVPAGPNAVCRFMKEAENKEPVVFMYEIPHTAPVTLVLLFRLAGGAEAASFPVGV